MKNKAIDYINLGLSVVPIRPDGSKRPSTAWQKYQTVLPQNEDVHGWGNNYHLGVICGAVSGGLEVIDIDSKYDLSGQLAANWSNLIQAQCPDILNKLVIQTTMSGGYHALYRCDCVEGNRKLATRDTTESEKESNQNDKSRVLIETRGEGGYVLIAPTPGYKFIKNDLTKLCKISAKERDVLISSAVALTEVTRKPEYTSSGRISPFDDYFLKVTDGEVIGMLQNHGWKVVSNKKNVHFLCRPGKDEKSISASYGHIEKMFYCFSTSTEFECNKGYTPAGVMSVLEHGGNLQETRKELIRRGFGNTEINSFGVGERKKEIEKTYISVTDCLEDIKLIATNRKFCDLESTGWRILDANYQIAKGQLNIISGIPSHGKSEWLDALMVNLANKGWKFGIFSPENYPVAFHISKLAEKKINKSILNITQKDLESFVDWSKDKFFWIDAYGDDIGLECLKEKIQKITIEKSLDGIVIDPWNEIDACRPSGVSETDYVGKSLMQLRKMSRNLNVAIWIVAHPTKLRHSGDSREGTTKNSKNIYRVPTLYDISGSAHWYNKADNGIIVYKNEDTTLVEIHVQKIKYKYIGQKGMVCLKWDYLTGNYQEVEHKELFEF